MSATDDLKTGAEIDAEMAIVASGTSPILHPDPSCPCARHIANPRTVRVENHPNNAVCRQCTNSFENVGGYYNGRVTCLSCGDMLMPDGTCTFCTRYERVMGD